MVRLKDGFIEEGGIKTIPFQFLMVRLKDRFIQLSEFADSISIPYGAIKSRLSEMENKIGGDFNSLWCD